MNADLRLRGHHIYCLLFSKAQFSNRGSIFLETEARVKQVIRSEPDKIVEIVEGMDDLCRVCPLLVGDQCQSPGGEEQKVRKWDARVLADLGLSVGTILSVCQLQDIFRAKSPIPLCARCRWRESCGIASFGAGGEPHK